MLSVVQDDYSEPRPKSLAEAIEERAKDKEWRGRLDFYRCEKTAESQWRDKREVKR